MAKVVHPIEAFDTQANGSVYYKDGIVLDDLRNIGPGVYSSWKYDFTNGRQVFRASKDDKIYEKRLVKDLRGNPQWTGWMEIPDAEARGIQAIAVNSGPLRLPNSDGALKLEITPALLKVFTRDETISLMEQRILDYEKSRSDYIEWPVEDDEGKLTPRQVLEMAFPAGGYRGTLYIVAKSPSASEDSFATQWLWNAVWTNKHTGERTFDWIQVNGGDYSNAFVMYEDFRGHTDDKVIHVEQTDKDRWNEASENAFEALDILPTKADLNDYLDHKESNDEHVRGEDRGRWNGMTPNTNFVEHVNDFVPHITAQERGHWNNKLDNIPGGSLRYLGEAQDWAVAFEQVNPGERKSYVAYSFPGIQNINSRVHEILPNFDTSNFPVWSEFFRQIEVQKGIVVSIQLTFEGIETKGMDCYFRTDDPGRLSGVINSAVQYFPIWDLGQKKFNRLFLEFMGDFPASTRPNITNLRIVITYDEAGQIVIGDTQEETPDKRLQVNVIGKPGSTLLYNGEPVDPRAGTTWDKIHGDIMGNDALMTIIKNQGDTKLSRGPATPRRWEITNSDVWVESLAQIRNQESFNYTIDLGHVTALVPHGGMIFEGIAERLRNIPSDQLIVSISLWIDHMSSAESAQGCFFMTDNPLLGRSHSVFGFTSSFQWNIPIVYNNSNNFERFDKILVYSVADSQSALRQANRLRLRINTMTFTGVEVGRLGKTLTLYSKPDDIGSIDINGTPLDVYFHERVVLEDWVWPPRRSRSEP